MNTAERTLDYFLKRNLPLDTAESCTAAKVVGLLAKVPSCDASGASGYVIYSPEAKQRF